MSVGGISTNAAISAFLAEERAAGHAAAANLRAEPVNPASLSRKVSDQDNAPQRQRTLTSESQGQDGGSLRAPDTPPETSRPTGAPGIVRAEPSTLFLVQIFGQETRDDTRPGLPEIDQAIKGHRDGAALGAEQYRLAGGEPSILTEGPTFLRIAI
jgi:hypothetical protein